MKLHSEVALVEYQVSDQYLQKMTDLISDGGTKKKNKSDLIL